MNRLLFALAWAALGAVVGLGLNELSRWLARIEEIDHAPTAAERWLSPALGALLFAVFAWRLGAGRLLLIDSVYVAILVQVFTFDLKHRLILDLVMYPSWVIALILAFVTPWSAGHAWPGADWRTAALGALIGGGIFWAIVIAARGGVGMGDAKLAVFIGMATGLTDFRVLRALLLGVFLGGGAAVLLLATRIRRMHDYIPYGPFLVVGTWVTLLVQQP